MAFWNDVAANIGHAVSSVGGFFGFGGGQNQNQKKKPEPGDPGYVAPTSAPTNPGQPQLKVAQPQNAFNTGLTPLTLPGANKNPANPILGTNNPPNFANPLALKPNTPPVVQKSQTEQNLDTLTQKNLPDAMKQTQQGENWFDKGVNFFTHDDEKIAQQNARNKAVGQYQDQNGYNQNPDVMKFMGNTRDLGNKTSQDIQNRSNTINNVIKTSSSIPVVSDFTAMGSGGASFLTDHGLNPFGSSDQAKADAHNNYTQATLGMTDQDISKLPADQQDRLRKLQTGLTVASPVMGALDIASLGGIGSVVSGFKSAALQGGKDALIQEGKNAAKTVGKNALIAGASAPVVSAPIENYINNGNALDFNGYDPSNIPRQSATAALWSVLLPGASKKPVAEDVNNARTVAIRDATEAAQSTARNAEDATRIKVQQPREIPVTDGSPEPVSVPVTNNTPSKQGQPIVEVGGDTPGVNQVKVPSPDEVAAAKFADQPQARPDRSIDGITPANTGNTGVFTRAEINREQQALDEALSSNQIDANTHKAASDQLSTITAADDAPKGQKINVKEVNSIPVADQSNVPTNLPEAPGTVRASTATDPNAVRTSEVAAKTPTPLPTEVQNVLDNPKQFNKRQVAAARNQAKLAKAYAKTQESTAESMDRIQTASPAAQSSEGFVPTGEFAKGQNGNIIQNVNRKAEMQQAVQETANMSPGDVIKTARDNAAQNGGGFNRRDIRNVAAMFEQKRVQRGTPEFNDLNAILKEDGTNWGQTGALRNYTVRRTASPDELVSRFQSKIYRLADDPSKIDSNLFDQIDAAETHFTDSRDAALQAYNKFTEAPTAENTKAYHAAQDAADAADKAAKMTEFKVASAALKGNKDVQQTRELEKMAQSADLYQMDAVDSSMLSGTGTFVRNFVNSGVGGAEEGLFGKVGARIASKITGENVGGGMGGDNVTGFGKGIRNIVDASKARAGIAGKNPLEHIKNFATTGNQLGDAIIDSQVTHNVNDHYTQLLKDQGYTGKELNNRAGVMARQDPNEVTSQYQNAARVAAGLGSGITRNNKVETTVKNIISDAISGGNPNKYTEGTAKLVTRMTLGFPTAIGRSLAEGTKRFTLGAPTFIRAMATKDPQARALLIKEGVKQAGAGGLVVAPMFYALGASGAITGSYPTDPEERAKWAREGITENSVKIGDNYYQLPSYLGSWAVPGLFYASLGRNNGDFAAAATDVAKIVPSLLPTSQASNISDVINGRTDFSKFMQQTGASAVRALTPGGAALNELAKSFDPTQNDTSSGTAAQNFIDKVLTGIPGAANTLPNKTDDQGNVLKNPDPLALALGASSTNQQAGVEHTGELNTQTNSTIKGMADSGAFADQNLKAILPDDATKKIYDDILAGKQASPANIKKLQNALTKGVTASSDTAYLEKGQYDTNLTALQVKRQLLAEDPSTKPSDLKNLDTSIKRGQVYKDNTVPYDLIKSYESTSQADWRAMGNPKSDNYDPEAYQNLWAIDQLMTKAGVSYKTGNLEKQKYAAKQAGSGNGGSGSRSFSTDFGKLKSGAGAPTVQQYQSVAARSGAIPVINTVRPNIVHKIGSSG